MGVIFLGSYLCISILEFKNIVLRILYEECSIIYVFLYQNLKSGVNPKLEDIIGFMYFYIRI